MSNIAPNCSGTATASTLLFCCAAGMAGGLSISWYISVRRRKKQQQYREEQQLQDASSPSLYEKLIGNTPCIELPVLSQLIQRRIMVKLENWNPGGTGKDRAAASMIAAAEKDGLLPPPCNSRAKKKKTKCYDRTTLHTSPPPKPKPNEQYDRIIQQAMQRSTTGGLIVEGTSGSTGISLATLAAVKGHGCIVVLPDDQANEKSILLTKLGAVVHVVAVAAISNPQHYVNVAQDVADYANRQYNNQVQAVFMNQFENLANFQVHYDTTGPEIWNQCRRRHNDHCGNPLQAFVMSAGTGGTIAGVGKYLKEQQQQQHDNTDGIQIVLVDPPGSVLYSKITHGVAFALQQREQALLRHRYDSLAEGIGLDRITSNLQHGLDCIDSAIAVTDQEAVDMAHWMLRHEGLLIGSSSAMNLVGAVRTALQLAASKDDSTVCTVICDSGQRHLTRFWNRDFVLSRGLEWPGDNGDNGDAKGIRIPECLQACVLKETEGIENGR